LARKLEALKTELKKWNEEVFGNVEKSKRVLSDELRNLDLVAEGRSLYSEERLRKEDITKDVKRFILVA
jgi:hypothetical protein